MTDEEVPGEEQAVAYIKLHDEVRELIRKEIKAALEDYGFVNSVYFHPLETRLYQGGGSSAAGLRMVVKQIIKEQMEKY